MRLRIATLLATLLLPAAPSAAQEPWASTPIIDGRGRPSVPLPRADATIEVDAVLDEPVWGQAARLGIFWQYEPVDGLPAEDSTEVLVWYSAHAVHFGFIAHDRNPSSIRATRADRDAIGAEDRVIVYLDTFDDQRRAFFFSVNPLGVQSDGVRTEGGVGAGNVFGGVTDDSPDYLWQSAGRITGTGWVAEIRVPFESLALPSNDPQNWSFQAQRQVQRTGHWYSWTDARRAAASFLLQAGSLTGITGIERGVTLEAQPFVTANLSRERFEDEADDDFGELRDDGIEPDVGVNLHAGFGAHALDLTINPDFSQVEADAARVTTNERFSLFFAEKRPFFLEGIELFATPNQLVYTRRIVDPLAGVKGAGKIGQLGYAAISALDEGTDGAPDALFNIARVRTDFGTNSLAGIVLTDRTEYGKASSAFDGERRYNRVVAADVRHVFAELYFIEAQLAQSFTGHDGGGSRDGQLWQLTYDRTGRAWGFNYRLQGVSPDFDADAGFIPRSDYVSGRAFNRLRWYGDPGDRVETFTTFFGGDRLWSYGRRVADSESFFEGGLGEPIEGGEEVNMEARLRGGWDVELSTGRGFVVFDPLEYAGIDVQDEEGAITAYVPLPRFSGFGVGFDVETPTYQLWEAGIGFDVGETAIFDEGAEGWLWSVEGGIGLRPTSWLRGSIGGAWQTITRSRDDSEYATAFIPRVQAEVQPSRALFFRIITEMENVDRGALVDARTGRPLLAGGTPIAAFTGTELRIDLLASYEPTPGTVAFLGYGASFGEGDDFGFRRDDLIRREDGFFAKVAYRFRL